MMQMQENNEGVEKMSNSLYFKILRSLNQDICNISTCMMVTNSPDEMPEASYTSSQEEVKQSQIEEEKVPQNKRIRSNKEVDQIKNRNRRKFSVNHLKKEV